ncbi:MAG: PQQ-binding-like beta-propeller repeat protein [Pirellulales bacterium]
MPHRLFSWLLFLIAAFAALLPATLASAQSTNYFRRDHGRPVADTAPLPAELTDEHLAWKTPLPPGHSTPLIVDDRIFLAAHEGLDLLTICLERSSGVLLWKQSVHVDALEKTHAEGGPATATPTSDGRRVYSFFGSYGLVCYTVAGDPVWTHRMGPFRDEFGSSSSPILVDGRIILCEDHDLDSFLIAINADDGQVAWQTPREGFTRSYATPVVWKSGNRNELVMAGALQLVAYDPATGRQLWSRDGFARIVNTTPALADGKLFICTWSPGGDTDARIAMEPWAQALQLWDKNDSRLLEKKELPVGEVQSRFYRIDLDDSQSLDEQEWNKYARIFELAQNSLAALEPDAQGGTPRLAWEYRRGLSYVASPLVYRDRLFMVKDGGIATLLAAASGKLIKQTRAKGDGNYYASPAGGDGKIYTASKGGVVTVFRLDPPLEIASSRDFEQPIFASPIVDDGRVYIRTDNALYAFGKR